jgi:hypothetical protein
LKNFIKAYAEKLLSSTSKFSQDEKILLFPEHLQRPFNVLGTISKSHGVSIEFTNSAEVTSVRVQYVDPRIDEYIFPKIGSSEKPALKVNAENLGITSINFVSRSFYDRYKEIIEVLCRSSNFLLGDFFGRFLEVGQGDIQLTDASFACLHDGKEWLKRAKFLWIFASNSQNAFSLETAEKLAKRDSGRIMAEAMSRVPIYSLLNVLSEYERLLAKVDLVEEDAQKFLEKNPMLISIDFKEVFPKFKLGEKYVVDFVIRTSDSRYVFVEIEDPNDRLYTMEKLPKQGKELREADSQMKEYLSYVKNNILYLQNRLAGLNVEKVSGLIIVGRSSRLSEKQLARLEKDNSTIVGYRILTYDELYTRIRTFLENLGIRYSHSQSEERSKLGLHRIEE